MPRSPSSPPRTRCRPSSLRACSTTPASTLAHFKEFIRVQMGWGQLLSSRYRAEGGMSEQDAVQKMLQQGGTKPTATEYLLQQVIFVVPASERAATLGKRKREAEAMRQRFTSCETTRAVRQGSDRRDGERHPTRAGATAAARLGGQHQERQARHRDRRARDRARHRIHRRLLEPRGVGRPRRPDWCFRTRARATTRRATSSTRNIVDELRKKARHRRALTPRLAACTQTASRRSP